MSTNPAAAPLDEAERLAGQESQRRAQLTRARSEQKRHEDLAKSLEGGAAVAWSPTGVVLGVLGMVTIPLAFAIYRWAFLWFWPEPGIALVAAMLFLTAGLVSGIVTFPAIHGIRLTGFARGLFTVASLWLPASIPTSGIGHQLWLASVGLVAALCLLGLPRYAISLIAHSRADRHRKLADRALEEVEFLSSPSQGGSV